MQIHRLVHSLSGPFGAPALVGVALLALSVLLSFPAVAGSSPAADDHATQDHKDAAEGSHEGDADSDEHGETDAPAKETHPILSAANYFTDAGRGGYGLFARRCQECHGFFLEGTEIGPALVEIAQHMDYSTRKAFHAAVTAHPGGAGAARHPSKQVVPEFNQLELIAKYLREFGEWQTDHDRLNKKE